MSNRFDCVNRQKIKFKQKVKKMITTIILIVVGVLIGMVFDRVLFGIWHKGAHSNKLKEEEKKQKEIEWKELANRRI